MCSVIEFGISNDRITGNYKLGNTNINKRTRERDMRVVVTDKMSPDDHVSRITAKTYNSLRGIRATFSPQR